MTAAPRFTSRDLEGLPDIEGVRYEIIDGCLYISRPTDWNHQYTCGSICAALQRWSNQTGAGEAVCAPGVIFAPDEEVIPDVVWISRERLANGLDDAGHLRVVPELVVEVLSPGVENEQRDREVKLALYSRRGMQEYWIVDWLRRTVQIYRRNQASLRLVATLHEGDVLTTPLLPDFACSVASLWTRGCRPLPLVAG